MAISKANVNIPEVMTDLIQFDYENALVLGALCQINTDLEGKPGDKVTIPYTSVLTDAATVAEGVAVVPEDNSDGTIPVSIVKAGKAVEMTEEAIDSAAYNVADTRRVAIARSLAAGVDKAVYTEMLTTNLKHDITADVVKTLTYDSIVDAQAKMGEEFYKNRPVLVVHSKQFADIRKSTDFKAGAVALGLNFDSLIQGMLIDVPVIVSDRITKDGGNKYHALLVAPGSVVLAYKKRPIIESDKDILSQKTYLASFVHYGVELANADRGVVEIITL